MDWNMLIVLLGGMLLGAGGMGLFLRRRPPREQQYARDMAMLADRLERHPADGEHPFVTMPCQGDTARVAAGIEKLADELAATRQRVGEGAPQGILYSGQHGQRPDPGGRQFCDPSVQCLGL